MTSDSKRTSIFPRFLRRAGFWKLLLLAVLCLSIFLIYLDAQIRAKFEGKRWAIPAQVYARPLEIYAGQKLSIEELKLELKGLGYRNLARANQPGSMEEAQTWLRLHTRGFDFTDGFEPAQRVLIRFNKGQVKSLESDGRTELPILRLEPIMIGGIYPRDNEDRVLVKLADVPATLKEGLVAVEDKNFYQHAGLSASGIARAFWVNLQQGRWAQGGSTLTQQLVKNFYLTSERSLSRKIVEIPMALLLDFHYDKKDILEAYINEVYLGQSGSRAVHGFAQASKYYFGRPLAELQVQQIALLIGIVKGPAYYNPRRYPARALKRRNLVLQIMADDGILNNAERIRAQRMPLAVVPHHNQHKGSYPAYLDLVKRQLRTEYAEELLNSEGLKVFTSLDPIVQKRAEQALVATIKKLQKKHGAKVDKLQAGMVVTDPQTSEVLALIGGRNTRYQGFNRALDARRSIGSLVKPALYLSALEQGYTLSSKLNDKTVNLNMPNGSTWLPQNFDGKTYGEVTLHRALARSYNLSAVNLGLDLGVNKVKDMLLRLGAPDRIKPYPSLFLGAVAMTPFEVSGIYQTLAANGFRMPVKSIRLVTSSDNQELSRYPLKVEQQVSPDKVHLMQYALQEVGRNGTAKYAYTQLPKNLNIAGKTGTSDGQRDSWFAGYTGNRLAVVWLGLDNNKSLPFTGSGGALRVWTEFMKREQPEPFTTVRPEGMEYHWVDSKSAKRTADYCLGAVYLPFIKGSAPSEQQPCLKRDPAAKHSWFQRWFK